MDDVLHLHHDTETFMKFLSEVYRLKDGSVGEPDRYLGANIEEVRLDDGSVAWSMTSRDYVTNEIQNLEDMLARDGDQPLKIFGKTAGESPFPLNYRPKLYVSTVSDDTLTSRYLQLVGVLRWAIK